MANEAAVFVEGCVGMRPTKMLVDTGSAVTILRELVRVEGSSRHSTPGTTSDRRKW